MTVAVLGASGFVGSALADRLERRGDEVLRLSRPQLDLTRPETFRRIPAGLSALVHAAGWVGDGPDPDLIWRTNVTAMGDLLERLRDRPPGLFVYLSSGSVYGLQPGRLATASPTRPDSTYGTTKLRAEELLAERAIGPWVALRLFFPFGPGQRAERLIPRLAGRIRRGEAVALRSERGRPVINPIFADTLVEQILRVMAGPDHSHYNLGGGVEASIRELAEAIGRVVGREPRFDVDPEGAGDLRCEPDFPDTSGCSLQDQLRAALR